MEVKLIDESCIEEIEKECYHENKYYYAGAMNVLSIIKNRPVRKDVRFRLFNNQYENVYRCCECNADFHSYTKITYNFCPYCGSKVIGEIREAQEKA